MTVQTNTNVASFNGNGVTEIFPIAFKFNNDADLVVLLIDDATGSVSQLTLNSDYTVSGARAEEGGLINVVNAPGAGQRLKVARIVDVLQLRDLRNQGKFFAEVHEDAFDLLTMIAQQHESGIKSALRVAESDPEPARIPSAAQRAGKILSFDTEGNPQVVAPVTDSSAALRLELAGPTGAAMIGYGGQSLESLLADLDSATTLQDGTGADTPVADALFQIMTRDRVNAAWYGFKATRTPAEQAAALAAAAAQAKIEGTRLYIPKDDYQLAAGVKIEVPVTMDGGSLDFSSGLAADFSATTSNGLLITGGGYTQLPNLAADAAKYSGSISFASAPSLAPGDVICIYNPTDSSWSGFRVDYRAGEFATVLRVDGTTVYLAGLLYESYTAGSVAIYKMNRLSGDFDFGGAEIIGPNLAIAGGAGVRFQNIVRSSIYGLTARNANYAQIGVWQSVDVDVYGCNAMTLQNTLNGTQYGLSLANTQSVRVHGGTFVSERHGVTMGGASGVGAVVTRDCHVYGAHITTRGDFAADFHGNVEHSSYEGCTLVGGATFGGNKNAYKNNKLITGGLGYGFFASEPKGTDFEFTGSEIEARTVAPSGRGVFDCIAITSNTVLGGTLSIKDMRIYGADQPSAFGANIRNYGSTAVGRRVNIDGLHIETPSAIAPCRVSTQSGTDWSSLTMGVVTSTGDETLTYISGVTTKRRMTLAAF